MPTSASARGSSPSRPARAAPSRADEIVIHEGGWRYAVDVAGGHKTGFYLDQRDARAAIAASRSGRRVLNVFAYTGAFSVIAAGNGAAEVTSIDSSGPALAGPRATAS